jgi:hypothetical protein
VTRCVLMVSIIVAWVRVGANVPAFGADVTGTVTDWITSDPIKGASVCITPKGKSPKTDGVIVGTNNDGKYEHKGVAEGDYVLDFDATGYQKTSAPTIVRANPVQMNQALMLAYVQGDFPAGKAATAYLKYAKAAGGRPQDFTLQWNRLRRFQIVATDRIDLALKVKDQDSEVMVKFPQLKQYTEADKSIVERISMDFQKSIKSGGESLPPKEMEKVVGDHLVADIITFELRSAKVDPKAKDDFINALQTKWDPKSPAVIKVNAVYGPERMRLIDPP